MSFREYQRQFNALREKRYDLETELEYIEGDIRELEKGDDYEICETLRDRREQITQELVDLYIEIGNLMICICELQRADSEQGVSDNLLSEAL